MKHKLKMDPEEVVQRVSEMVAYAKSFCEDVEFSARKMRAVLTPIFYMSCWAKRSSLVRQR